MDTKPLEAERRVRGEAIARGDGQIRRVWDGLYYVRSQHLEKEYQVSFDEKLGWSCSCPDFAYRQNRLVSRCKHVWAVQISIRIRHTVDGSRVVKEVSVSECLFCHSQRMKKFGIRHNKSGDIQRFECADCHRTFSVNVGFDRMKHNPKAITTALQLYFSGESLRATQRSLRLLGVEVSFKTVHNWIRKYVNLMAKYADQIKPEVGDTWRADEVWVKVKGDMKYLFAMMDDQTRYWIAQEVADTKERHDARNLFRKSAEIAGKKPETLITDGLRSYELAFKKEYRNLYNDDAVKPVHIKEIALAGRVHNNKMERMNGEVRDREKVFRGLKSSDTPILKGIQIYHNFIKPHEGLGGQTPAERAGIQVEGKDKWLTLIQNASRTNS